MRKKKMSKFFDDFMWYLIYLLPIFVMLVTRSVLPISDMMSSLGLSILIDNPIYATMSQVFGSAGVLPLFESNDIICYMTYFISVFIIHLAVDFVLFIPRLAHKWLDSIYKGGCDD